MASPATIPPRPVAGGAPPPGGVPGAGGAGPSPVAAAAAVTHDADSPTQSLIKLGMDAQKIAQDSPETAPMMREVGNQVRLATMKLIQMRQQAQQQAPQI